MNPRILAHAQKIYQEALPRTRFAVVLVYSTPGGGKSLATKMALEQYVMERKRPLKIVFMEPRRSIRDFMYSKTMRSIRWIVRARDEVCNIIASRLSRRRFDDYLRIVANTCPRCSVYRTPDCPFYKQFRDLLSIRKGIIYTTHYLGFIVSHVARPDIIVIDEFEDYFTTLSRPVEVQVLEEIKSIDRKLYRSLRSSLIKIAFWYYPHPRWISILSKKTLLLSATVTRNVEGFIMEEAGWRERYYSVIELRNPVRDGVVVHVGDLVMRNPDVRSNIWFRAVVATLSRIVAYGVENYGVVGVSSRSKQMTRVFHDIFSNMGFKVTSDVYDNTPVRDAEVWIITTRGKWYRGISLRPRSQEDFPVIVGFYQAQTSLEKKIPPWLLVLEDPVYYDGSKIPRELVLCENVQTLFRFNRIRDLPHVLVLMDRRLYTALERTMFSYVEHLKEKRTSTLDKLYDNFKEVCENLLSKRRIK